MRGGRRWLAAASLVAGLATAAGAATPGEAAPEVHVRLAPEAVTAGDRVDVELVASAPAGSLSSAPRFPVWGERWGAAEVIAVADIEALPARAGVARYRQRLELAAFRPGTVSLPPLAVAFPFREETVEVGTPSGLAFEVRSVLPPDPRGLEPRPPAAPAPLPFGRRFWWTMASLGAVALATAGAAANRWRSPLAAGPAAAALADPWQELAGNLAALQGESDIWRLHTALSLALRTWLSRVLSFPAPERTTTEIQRTLGGRRLPPDLVRRTIRLLRACDLVKFARRRASREESRVRLAEAESLATAWQGALAPAPAGDESGPS